MLSAKDCLDGMSFSVDNCSFIMIIIYFQCFFIKFSKNNEKSGFYFPEIWTVVYLLNNLTKRATFFVNISVIIKQKKD